MMRLAVLCYESLESWQEAAASGEVAGAHPFGMDHLKAFGFQLAQQQEPHWVEHRTLRKLRDVVEHRYGAPLVPTFISFGRIRRADVTLALFEREGFTYSRMRKLRIPPMSSVPLVVVSCWLAHSALTADKPLLTRFRRWVAGVDLLLYLSKNQRAIYQEKLGVPDDKLHYVPFGVVSEYFHPGEGPRDGYVAAIGQTGRDWTTLLRAASELDIEFRIAARFSDFRGLQIPKNVRLLGPIRHPEYRKLLQQARTVVTCVHPHYAFPAGQSVLLEAMACGTPTIVTDTVPLTDYTSHGSNTLVVPPCDSKRLVGAVEQLLSDRRLHAHITMGGLHSVARRFNAQAMWSDIADTIRRRFT